MKTNHKIPIDMREFVLNGHFDCVKIGQTRSWLRSNFPEPDDWLTGETIESSAHWRYGNLKFVFENDRLVHIISDCFRQLDGGTHFDVRPWILNDSPSFAETTQLLVGLGVDHETRIFSIINRVDVRVSKSEVALSFCQEGRFGPSLDYVENGPWHLSAVVSNAWRPGSSSGRSEADS
ncbi:MAG: hypothetical protein ACJA1R_001982 [Flavobacteriales bacterium]|jgi:hypothetical protein